MTSAINVTFGKEAPGASYKAVYIAGVVDGVSGAYRSDDGGANWIRINDDAHQYGNWADAMAR
uniref:CAZy families CBM3/CBM2/GH74 protein n=1 Tax=uncultured Acidothermus sp. TaxID=246138 RepID=A0A060C1K7_9ACTN|nr:CAZy families CBM3/CBM2/GH74 protein [uncultured Acidothermus sp.]